MTMVNVFAIPGKQLMGLSDVDVLLKLEIP